jgi:hypothetical protein
LRDIIAAARPEIASMIDPSALDTIIDALACYLIAERVRLRLHTSIQAAANLALDRDVAHRALTGDDITKTFGHTVRDALSDFFRIDIQNSVAETVLSTGPHKRVVTI